LTSGEQVPDARQVPDETVTSQLPGTHIEPNEDFDAVCRKRPKYHAPSPEHPDTTQPVATTEIHANHLEAFHTSLRRRCAAYRRRTNMYAKKTGRLQERLDVYWIVHNFVRVHFTTRQVPAVALGVLEEGFSLQQIFLIQKEKVFQIC
jgi:hypothetical protein